LSQTLPAFSAVIFDLDGLVLDTESTYLIAWQHAVELMGHDFSKLATFNLSGLHYQDLVKILYTCFGATFDLKRFNQLAGDCWRDYVNQHGIARKKGFDELWAVLNKREIPFCLATNSAEKNARECLSFAGLDNAFTTLISRDNVKLGKPAPDIFLYAAQCLAQPVSHCLVLEDSLIGIQAALAAEAIAVLIPSQPLPQQRLISEAAVFADLAVIAEIVVKNAV
jgi:beta-phosphoglucomutase